MGLMARFLRCALKAEPAMGRRGARTARPGSRGFFPMARPNVVPTPLLLQRRTARQPMVVSGRSQFARAMGWGAAAVAKLGREGQQTGFGTKGEWNFCRGPTVVWRKSTPKSAPTRGRLAFWVHRHGASNAHLALPLYQSVPTRPRPDLVFALCFFD